MLTLSFTSPLPRSLFVHQRSPISLRLKPPAACLVILPAKFYRLEIHNYYNLFPISFSDRNVLLYLQRFAFSLTYLYLQLNNLSAFSPFPPQPPRYRRSSLQNRLLLSHYQLKLFARLFYPLGKPVDFWHILFCVQRADHCLALVLGFFQPWEYYAFFDYAHARF